MPKLEMIGVDADDTLWHNQRFFDLTQARFAALLAPYTAPEGLVERLQAAEARNLGHYGFGIKGFTLSMIETAIEVTDARVPAPVISDLIAMGQEMLCHPVELLPHAEAALRDVSSEYRLVLITKGDLLDQERKLAQSGLGDFFDAVEIVSDKSAGVYRGIFSRHGVAPARAAMVGNSMRSDVLPVIEAGGWGVHVPQAGGWAYESAPEPVDTTRFRTLTDLGGLFAALREMAIF